jgi:hypothetical protein
MNRIRAKRPSPSMIVALLALFISLGGVGYAASKIGSAQIADNSIRSRDIHNRTVAGKDVKPNALGNKQIDNRKLEAANAAALGGAAPSAYLKGGDSAGGALAGAYPNPGLAKTVVPLTLNAGWSPATQATPAVWKDAYDVVHLRGAVLRDNASTSEMPFNLPEGYRPVNDVDSGVPMSGGFGVLIFHPDGSVTANPVTGGASVAIIIISDATFEAGI